MPPRVTSMDQTILVIHSQSAVIAHVLDALERCADRILAWTEPSITASLCTRYQPDLLLLGWEPDRFGGLEGFRRITEQSERLVTILLTPPDVAALPAVCLHHGVRGCHRLPTDGVRLRAQVERALWITRPQRELKQLTHDLVERAKSLDTFLTLSRAITANLELDPLLHIIAEETSHMLNADRTSLFIYDREHNRLWSRVAEGERDRTIQLSMDEPGIVVHVAKTRQPLQVDDAYREPLFNRQVDRMTGYHTQTILGFPVLNHRGELIGVIETLNKKSGQFDRADERLLSVVSFLFAAAIENAQLYEALRRQIRENETLEAAKIQAERLAVVGQMASSIIHDIRSPLAIIRGYAELSVTGTVSVEKRQRFANTITAEVHRLHDMAHGLQEFSEGVQHLDLVPTPVGPLIDEMMAFFEGYFKQRGIQVIYHSQYTGVALLDGSRIKRALYNIATNAADAMPNGGTFTITTAQVGEQLHIELQDTGCGIPDAIRSRLFEPFVTAGKPHGTGLGLAVVKRIIEDHGGDISVASSSAGTTFTIRLPLRSPAR